jgi:TetR/AcrR family transcriptional repressor of nem operon
MPRVSRQQAAANRRAITEASARLLRERGIRAVSVSDLMAEVGLTHGGFYGHFASKDALVAEGCRAAFERSIERWRDRVASPLDPAAARRALLEAYLSTRARERPGDACPAAALAGDVARERLAAPVRAVFIAGVEALLAILTAVQPQDAADASRRQALADFATMVGALLLARATSGQELSSEFLAAALASLQRAPRRRTRRKSVRRAAA